MAGLSFSKKDFSRFCRLLYQRGLVSGTGGNLAMRARRGIYLTPSGYSLGRVTPEKVVMVSQEGEVLEGGQPTKDMEMHLEVLRKKPGINVVCHVHGAYIIAASAMLTPGPSTLPPLTPGFVFYAYPLPMLPFMVPGTRELAQAVVQEFSTSARGALLLQNHGLITIGRDFEEAFNLAEEVHEAAQIYVLSGAEAKTIPFHELEKIGGTGKPPENDST